MRDDIYREMIKLCVEMNRRAEAVRLYERLERMMRTEFGAAPDPDVARMVREWF